MYACMLLCLKVRIVVVRMVIKEIFNSFTASSLDRALTGIALNYFCSTGVSLAENQMFWNKTFAQVGML